MKITKEQLDNHKKWVDGKEGGVRLVLRRANLREADLSGAYLNRADLRDTDLSWADLRRANLREADLSGAYLSWANLRGADLREANLREANLRGADLREAKLNLAYLRRANLREADLSGAYLNRADLRGADLSLADLREAELNFTSHDLMAEILRQHADNDIEKIKIAGLILIQKRESWCWKEFLALDDPNTDWALSTLAEYVTDGDNAPAILRRIALQNESETNDA